MPTPRDLIHFGMATFTTSSCHPQAFKRRLVRKNASCGRWSWLAFTPSCSPHYHAIMPTPRGFIHLGMATFTTSSCHPQASKRRLVRKNASCGRWSWLAFTPSCSSYHHANPNECIYELGFKYQKAVGGIGERAQRLPPKQNESTSSHMLRC